MLTTTVRIAGGVLPFWGGSFKPAYSQKQTGGEWLAITKKYC
ncbi:MAG: hypothetical protein ACRDBM_03365 [Sporomusa sp.]